MVTGLIIFCLILLFPDRVIDDRADHALDLTHRGLIRESDHCQFMIRRDKKFSPQSSQPFTLTDKRPVRLPDPHCEPEPETTALRGTGNLPHSLRQLVTQHHFHSLLLQ